MSTYTQLNHGWNADPNAPDARVRVDGEAVCLSFRFNAFEFPRLAEGERGELRFPGCTRYRLGPPNDEGWFAAERRGPPEVPPWGEFYQMYGDAATGPESGDWRPGPGQGSEDGGPPHRFLFYLRDATFECEAAGWLLAERPAEGDR